MNSFHLELCDVLGLLDLHSCNKDEPKSTTVQKAHWTTQKLTSSIFATSSQQKILDFLNLLRLQSNDQPNDVPANQHPKSPFAREIFCLGPEPCCTLRAPPRRRGPAKRDSTGQSAAWPSRRNLWNHPQD